MISPISDLSLSRIELASIIGDAATIAAVTGRSVSISHPLIPTTGPGATLAAGGLVSGPPGANVPTFTVVTPEAQVVTLPTTVLIA